MAIQRWRSTHVLFGLPLALLLGGCAGFPGAYPGGGDPYGYPDRGYGGDPYGYPDRGYGSQVLAGSVQAFDPSSGRLRLASEGGYGPYGSSIEVWVDSGTRLFYQGREQDVRGLEPGDRVRIDVLDDGRRLRARSIEVTHNVREGYYGSDAGSFEAAVRYVDPRRRLIEVTRGGYTGRVEQVWYDERTRFDHRGRPVGPTQLEPGDLVRIQARPSGGGWLATWVTVTVDARSR